MHRMLLSYFLIFLHVQAWEYCKHQGKICPPETEHLMCKPMEPYEDKPNMYMLNYHSHMPATSVYKKYVLKILNDWRNEVAGGMVLKFPKAARMRELVWDFELEFLAKERNKGHSSVKDKCRATKRFPKSGQYVAPYGFQQRGQSSLYYVNNSMQVMWTTKDTVENPDEWAANFTKKMKAKHFAQLTNDRVSRAGCSVITGYNCTTAPDTPPSSALCVIITCNFDYSWIHYKEVYKAHPSTPGGECSYWGGAGLSKMYPNLCANDGSLYLDRIKD